MINKFFFIFLITIESLYAQLPETDIFVCDMKMKDGKFDFSKPENITHRAGYDNQPYFMPDGKSLLYVSIPDTTQADIFSFDFKSKKSSAVTKTTESEYSPMLTPDGKNISVVRVDSDKGQRFYKFPMKDQNAALIKGSDSIGYYCWLNPNSLAMFILGDAMTLQVLDINKNERKLVASDVGRCMKLTNDQKKLLFVIKQNENEWSIFEMDIATMEKKKVVGTIPGSEDYAVLKDGSLIMGSKGKLYRYSAGQGEDWKEIADFSAELGDFYRIAVNAQGDKIAMVAFTGRNPDAKHPVIKRDYIIVGQGIAGSLLASFLQKNNQSVILIDDEKPNASSRIAAGIIHPITGRRIVKTWLADILIPFAENFYRDIEKYFGVKIFHSTGVIELLSSAKEFNDWMSRSEEQDLGTFIDPSFDSVRYDEYLQVFFKKILVKKSAWINTSVLLAEFRDQLMKDGNLLNEKFGFESLKLTDSAVAYNDIGASKIIFCEGAAALSNPYWEYLPFIPAKGEIITVKADMHLDHILNRKIFILPLGDNLFKVGSTYSWNFNSELPTSEAKEELISELKAVIKIPFEVVDQSAGIRPTVKDRRPFLGLHKQFPQVGIFNGLGTKGCLLAPFFANHLAGYLTGKNDLMKEVDVRLLIANGQ